MATFKVGQRVRVIGAHHSHFRLVGLEGVVVGYDESYVSFWGPLPWEVRLDGSEAHEIKAFAAHQLQPLTDPKADAFIERIKQIKPEPEMVPLFARPTAKN